MLTDAEKKAREEQMAKLLHQMEDFFQEEGDMKKFSDRIKAVEGSLKADGHDISLMDKSVIEDEFEKLRAQNERVIRGIQNSKRGAYFPGIEDEAKRFSVVKTLAACAKKDWTGAEHEKECIEEAMAAREKATGQAASDLSRGGGFIADQLIPDVIGPMYTKSAFIAMDGDGETRVTVLDGLPGGRVTIPQFHGGMQAYWMGEEDSFTTSTSKVSDVHMDLKKIGVMARMTDTMIKFASYGFDNLLRKDMIKALVKKVDYTIPYGSGSANMPRGIANWSTGGHQAAGTDNAGNDVGPGVKVYNAGTGLSMTYAEAMTLSAGAGFVGGEIDFDSLSLMKLMFEEDDVDTNAGSFAWVAAPRYWDRLKRIKTDNYASQTTGQPYLVGLPVLPDARVSDLVGPFGRMNQIATNSAPGGAGAATAVFGGASTTAKFSGIFGGDFSEFIFGRGSGIEIEDDGGVGTGFSTDSTYLKLRMYADQMIRDPRAIGFCPDVRVRD
tara:strand:- start:3863 stop:5350 length:1488 start_codon:yes stop_codon:yes gene_type:complete